MDAGEVGGIGRSQKSASALSCEELAKICQGVRYVFRAELGGEGSF